MTNETILKKAIKKADIEAIKKFDNTFDWKAFIEEDGYYMLIFSHDFAKAFWGDKIESCKKKCKQNDGLVSEDFGHWHLGWQQHLPIMVLEEDPIKYLEKFI